MVLYPCMLSLGRMCMTEAGRVNDELLRQRRHARCGLSVIRGRE